MVPHQVPLGNKSFDRGLNLSAYNMKQKYDNNNNDSGKHLKRIVGNLK